MPKRILAVEDEPDIATVIRLLFDPLRFHVMLVDSLGAARALLLEDPRPDLVLLNVVLPDGNGLDLCRDLKSQPHAPLIVAPTAATDAVEAARKCADLVVTKPFDPDSLVTTVESLLGNGHPNGKGPKGSSGPSA